MREGLEVREGGEREGGEGERERLQMREGLDVSLHGEYAYDDDAVKNAKKALLGELKK